MHASTGHFIFRHVVLLCLLCMVSTGVQAELLKPYKDELFAYPQIVTRSDGGDYTVVDYQELRDINERDQIPERRVKRPYVSLIPAKARFLETLSVETGPLDVARVGPSQNAAFTVIFVHGRGGDRRLGNNDYSFGGNFNRIKNLSYANGGAYYAPSVGAFDQNGVSQVASLIKHVKQSSPGRPVFVACASMGSFVCWGLMREAETVANLKGMMIMSGAADANFLSSAGFKAKLPLFFSHGSRDSVYTADEQTRLYRTLKAKKYPARFVLFEGGNHGTPIRMTDWRDALNWLDQ
ncbi:alpha/beta hydrolase [Rhizobium sp. CFBP 8762]|uniref:alpha/beta hydrolase n=1 Tax=Rhizobium sp. CFBP 8762 TaxID=2775279 RepID=UPI00177B778E|nr:alpha/beta hydrolase [Rhizobium sp. CFBP 8762]MBD8555686.1 alpha/beta hydrolase [Rhizobium sp. CFBP 8762]